jgi:hypothetical protein
MASKEKKERPWKHQWLDLVEDTSNLPAPTRHLLLSLGRRMEADGSSCYPSTRTIAERTGLSERTVCTHLAIAEAAGWLKRSARGRVAGQAWRGHEYRPAIPPKVLNDVRHVRPEGTEADSVPIEKGTEPHDKKVLKDVQSSSTKSSSTNTGGILGERARYSPEQLQVIDEAIEAFRSTRKTNRIADSVILTEFRWWKDRPIDQVVTGLRTYVAKGCAVEGKGEKYARGIIRNSDDERAPLSLPRRSDFPEVEDSRAEHLAVLRAQSMELSP